jgi:fimbrial chaperone protein
MRVRNVVAGLLASAAAVLPSAPTLASSFSVSPLRVDFSAQSRTGALTIRSREDTDVVVEAQVMAWTQVDGEDRLTPSREVLVSPVVFSLAPNGSQLVRVALQRAPDARRELSYRLILSEVPPQNETFSGLNVALRISLPVFVAATTPTPASIEWSATRVGDALDVTARNVGDAHAHVLNFSVAPATPDGAAIEQTAAAYILPDQTKTWPLTPSQWDGTSGDWRRLRVKGATEAGDFELEIGPDDR